MDWKLFVVSVSRCLKLFSNVRSVTEFHSRYIPVRNYETEQNNTNSGTRKFVPCQPLNNLYHFAMILHLVKCLCFKHDALTRMMHKIMSVRELVCFHT